MSDYLEFLKRELGPNYVIARRTPRIIDKYGTDVNCITPTRHAEVTRQYRMLHGREYDEARAAMYVALNQIHCHLVNGDNCKAIMTTLANAALKKEQATF